MSLAFRVLLALVLGLAVGTGIALTGTPLLASAAAAIEVAMGTTSTLSHSAPGVIVLDVRSRIILRSGPVAAQMDDLADLGITVERKLPYAVISVLVRLRSALKCAADPFPLSAELRAQGSSGRWYTLRASLAEPDAGDSTTRIATRLSLSPYTVQDHLDHACEKVGVRGCKALLAKIFFDGYAAGSAA